MFLDKLMTVFGPVSIRGQKAPIIQSGASLAVLPVNLRHWPISATLASRVTSFFIVLFGTYLQRCLLLMA